ncbi:MAG: Gfo/Idh/MocA family oxidoreductase [Oscillospiraceae bacterium]|nr:Gfo/Idh/MocA family oxidoreductase [Oscillospiraceae bacterium]
MKKLRWGVIGAGGIADRRTIPGLLLAKNAELTAIMEVTDDFSQRLRQKYSVPHAYSDEYELLKDAEVDAVYIASPVEMHAKQAMAAADFGKHILVEKPLALTSAEGDRVVEYCKSKKVLLAAGLMMRFGSYVNAMKAAIAAGKIGDVITGYAQFTCWYPDIEGAWRQSKSTAGGGALMDMGVHCIDLIQYITGGKVRQVAGLHSTMTFNYDVEDSSSIMLRLDNGAICVVQSNFNIPDDAAKWRLEFFGTKGRLLGDMIIGQVDGGSLEGMFMGEVGGYDAAQEKKESEAVIISAELGNMYQREIESFGDSVLYGAKIAVPALDAVQVQRVIEAAYLSNDKKIIVDLE